MTISSSLVVVTLGYNDISVSMRKTVELHNPNPNPDNHHQIRKVLASKSPSSASFHPLHPSNPKKRSKERLHLLTVVSVLAACVRAFGDRNPIIVEYRTSTSAVVWFVVYNRPSHQIIPHPSASNSPPRRFAGEVVAVPCADVFPSP